LFFFGWWRKVVKQEIARFSESLQGTLDWLIGCPQASSALEALSKGEERKEVIAWFSLGAFPSREEGRTHAMANQCPPSSLIHTFTTTGTSILCGFLHEHESSLQSPL
jgi:hypothetical protein